MKLIVDLQLFLHHYLQKNVYTLAATLNLHIQNQLLKPAPIKKHQYTEPQL